MFEKALPTNRHVYMLPVLSGHESVEKVCEHHCVTIKTFECKFVFANFYLVIVFYLSEIFHSFYFYSHLI